MPLLCPPDPVTPSAEDEDLHVQGPPPSPVTEMTSVIILCCNELPYTRLCLESVWRHTPPPYELLLVDNGSTDGTPAYLDEIRSRPGPVRVEVIRNETNRGFAAGCNQARAQAGGRYVVFLNNDTIVTPAWLEGLIEPTRGPTTPPVGLVGPVSNFAAAAQHVDVDYTDQEGLARFADRRRQECGGRYIPVSCLSGFCLLARREVLDRLGGFDERYGLGFFDDDDLCLRARKAGYGIAVACSPTSRCSGRSGLRPTRRVARRLSLSRVRRPGPSRRRRHPHVRLRRHAGRGCPCA
jgi:GT2 family glycosyltransferase